MAPLQRFGARPKPDRTLLNLSVAGRSKSIEDAKAAAAEIIADSDGRSLRNVSICDLRNDGPWMTLVLHASTTVAWLFEDERTDATHEVMEMVVTTGAIVPLFWRR